MSHDVPTEQAMRLLGAEVGSRLKPGDVVLLEGELGAGKTTFVRGYLESLGVTDPVRSPTFNLIQTFETDPSVMHADLYRVTTYKGIGIEDYLDSHVCFIEWPDRAEGLFKTENCWTVKIEFEGAGRRVSVAKPDR